MTLMPSGHTTGARFVVLVAISIVAALAVIGCGDSDTKDQAHHADAVQARIAREHRERLRTEKLRRRRARQARARKARQQQQQQQASSCGAGLVRQNGYCVVPQPAGGGQTTTPSDQAPSVDSPQGQQKLKQDPDCQGLPSPPPSYHGPVQC